MKAIIFTPSFLPQLNGMTYATVYHIQLLRKLKIDVTVITGVAFDIQACNDYDLSNVDIIKSDISGSGLPWSPVNGSINKVCEIISEIDPDIVFVEGWYNWGINVMLSLPDKYKKIVFSHGSSDLKVYGISSLIRLIGYYIYDFRFKKQIYQNISGVVLLSEYEDNDRFRDGKIAKSKNVPTIVVPNGNLGSMVSKKLDFIEKILSGFNVAIIGEMNSNKNQRYILKILNQLNPNVNFHLFYPSKNKYLIKLKSELNDLSQKNRILFYEGLNRIEINEFIKNNINLILVLSRTEAQPIVIIDALWLGIPYLSTDVGCVRAIEGGLVCNLKLIKSNLNMLSSNFEIYDQYRQKALVSGKNLIIDIKLFESFL
jgi:hypothetical protein